MNKLLKREFLPTKLETQSYKTKEGVKTISSTRKRWYATMECSECNKIFTIKEQSKNAHLNKPCQACAKKVLAYKNFIKKAQQKHGDRFDYSLIDKNNYVNLFTAVSIICKTHGKFLQKPKDHTSNTNAKICCPQCVIEFNKIRNKKSIEHYKKELSSKHSHIKMVQHLNANSNTEKCTLECKHHGTFISTLAHIKQQKYLCPLCAQDHNSWGGRFRRTDVKGTIYFIHIPKLQLWKLGVTSTSIKERLKNLSFNYIIEWECTFSTLAEAYKKESLLFKQFKDFRRDRNLPKVLGKCKGNSELMTCSIPISAIHGSNSMSKET